MIGFLTSKLGTYVIVGLLLSGTGLYVKYLIEKNALMGMELENREMAMEGMANEFSNYALNSEAIIDAYNINSQALQKKYQESRDIIQISVQRTAKHDYQKLLNHNPSAFVRRANAATSKLFLEFEKNSNHSKDKSNRKDPETTITGSDKADKDKMD